GSAAPPAGAHRAAADGHLHVAAEWLSAPREHDRHVGFRPAGDAMPPRPLSGRCAAPLVLAAVLCSLGVRAQASELFVSNEVDDTVTVLDGDSYKVIATIPTDQRPRGIVQTLDHKAVLVCDG